jgi:hypothetical protein
MGKSAAIFNRLAAAAWISGCLAGIAAGQEKPEPKGGAGRFPPFSRKVLIVFMKGPPERACLLDNARIQKVGDRTFLVGTAADEGAGRAASRVGYAVWILPDQVGRLFEFENLESARKVGRQEGYFRAASPGEDGETYEFEERSFIIPIAIDPANRPAIKRVNLYVSTDLGKAWKHFTDVGPEEVQCRYTAPAPGHYWFAVQVIQKNGKKYPEYPNKLTAAMKVRVWDKLDAPPTPPRTAEQK